MAGRLGGKKKKGKGGKKKKGKKKKKKRQPQEAAAAAAEQQEAPKRKNDEWNACIRSCNNIFATNTVSSSFASDSGSSVYSQPTEKISAPTVRKAEAVAVAQRQEIPSAIDKKNQCIAKCGPDPDKRRRRLLGERMAGRLGGKKKKGK